MHVNAGLMDVDRSQIQLFGDFAQKIGLFADAFDQMNLWRAHKGQNQPRKARATAKIDKPEGGGWKEGEQPAAPQIEEAVSIFLQELQLKGHQAIYALHADTDNFHLHIAVNRVHPLNGKVIKPNKGFDLEAAHRAIAKIELRRRLSVVFSS